MVAHNQIATRPSLLKLMLEIRSPYELGAALLSWPAFSLAPSGDGHPVMVLPGFMATDHSTLALRRFLAARGYRPFGWGMGRNYGRGIHPRLGVTRYTNIFRKLVHLHTRYESKVSLIGWSLGGLYARELTRLAPYAVRQVITLGSPFTNNVRANNVVHLFERMSRHRLRDIDPALIERMRKPLPTPSTAIFSRTDGIAAWQCCIEQVGQLSENIEVESSHCGLGHHPLVWWAIADRLAQPEGEWRPFERKGWRRVLYYDPERATPY